VEININEILEKIPHRYPFLLIDRVLKYTPGPQGDRLLGRNVIAIKNVTFNEPFFQGHFPEDPIMPGVLQIEAMAQAGAIGCVPNPGDSMDVMIVKVDKAKFRKPVKPGDQLVLEAKIVMEKSSMVGLECTAKVDGELVSSANMMARVSRQSKSQAES